MTDGKSIATLAIVQSLAEKGIEVTCGEEYRACPAFFSKYVKHRVVYPSPEKNPDDFVDFMYKQTRKYSYDVIMPVSDDTALLLSKYKDVFSQITTVPVTDFATFLKARNKSELIKIAIKNEIPCPVTYFPEEQELVTIKKIVTYPAVIRACYSNGSRGIVKVNNQDELEKSFDQMKQAYNDIFIQEFVPNDGNRYDLSCLRGIHNEEISFNVIHGLRFFPDKVGPQSYAITVEYPEIVSYGKKLITALNWFGVANVEFVIDKRDGMPKLMEVNPRFWNGVKLDIAAGIDFPYLLYQIAKGKDIVANNHSKIGTKWRWLFPADILWFLTAKKTRREVFKFLHFFENDLHYATFSHRDAGPLIGVCAQSLRYAFSREKRDLMFKRGL